MHYMQHMQWVLCVLAYSVTVGRVVMANLPNPTWGKSPSDVAIISSVLSNEITRGNVGGTSGGTSSELYCGPNTSHTPPHNSPNAVIRTSSPPSPLFRSLRPQLLGSLMNVTDKWNDLLLYDMKNG